MGEALPLLSVLVVDDQLDTAESTAELLSLHGCQTRIATSGAEALQVAATHPPDVVLLDIGMPGMDGWEFARRLRSQTIGKQPIVVAVSGYGSLADRQHSADTGIDMHLVKPADPAHLTDMLAKIRSNSLG